jgi:hypothetical protein
VGGEKPVNRNPVYKAQSICCASLARVAPLDDPTRQFDEPSIQHPLGWVSITALLI